MISAFLACSHSSENIVLLEKAESLMTEHPDSALMVLESINSEDLKNGRERALYGLLLTMAEDKNYLDPKNDSLIIYSSEYFEKKGDLENQVKSNYYRGRVLSHREEFPKALVSFFKAKELGEKNREQIFWAGMACRGIADIYNLTFNSSDEVFYAEKEVEYIKEDGRQPYLNYSILDLARALNNNDERVKSISITNQLIDSAISYKDEYLLHEARQIQARNFIALKDYKSAQGILEVICENMYACNEDSLFLCYSLIETGLNQKAENLLNHISPVQKPYKNRLYYMIFKKYGYYDLALEQLEKKDSISSINLRNAMSHNLSSYLSQYFEFNNELAARNLKLSHTRNLFIILFSSLIVIILIVIIIYIKQKNKTEIDSKLWKVAELEENIKALESQETKFQKTINTIFRSQYSLIDELSDTLRQNFDSDKSNKLLLKKIDNLITGLSLSGNKIKKLEDEIDKVYSNVTKNFRIDFPEIKEIDYLIFIYTVSGFSISSICLFLNERKIESIYNRKRRLKSKIKCSDSQYKDLYLKLLN